MRTFIFIKNRENRKEPTAIVGMVQSDMYPSTATKDPESPYYLCDCLEVTEKCNVKI